MQGLEKIVLWVLAGLALMLPALWGWSRRKMSVYLSPVKRELKKEKQWLRRGEYNAAMVKGRQNLELLLKLVAEFNGIQLDNTAQAVANLKNEQESGGRGGQGYRSSQGRGSRKQKVMTHQQFGRWLADNGYLDRVARWELNQIRITGNKAVHENFAEKEAAWNQYQYLEDILKVVSERHHSRSNRQSTEKNTPKKNSGHGPGKKSVPKSAGVQGQKKKGAEKSAGVQEQRKKSTEKSAGGNREKSPQNSGIELPGNQAAEGKKKKRRRKSKKNSGQTQNQVPQKETDQKAANQKPASQKAPDQKAANQKPASQKAPDQKAANQKPANQEKPASQKKTVGQESPGPQAAKQPNRKHRRPHRRKKAQLPQENQNP